MKEMKKKYSAVDLTDLAIGILVLGIAVTIGANILLSIRDNRLTQLPVETTVNETTLMNSSAGADSLVNSWGASVSACYSNHTGASAGAVGSPANITIPTANYTVAIDGVGGGITVVNSTVTSYQDPACTYTWYNTSRPDWSLPNDAAIGLAEYGNWFDIIVIVGIAGLILSLIFLAFGQRGTEQGVVY